MYTQQLYDRGEGTEGYSEALRQLEFTSAFRAEMADYLMFHNADADDSAPLGMQQYLEDIQFLFQDALTYEGPVYGDESEINRMDANNVEFEGEPIPLSQVKTYESAMQYVAVSLPLGLESTNSSDQTILSQVFQSTIQRCSLIRTAFQIVAQGCSYEDVAMEALANGSFDDKMEGGINEDASWSIRLRRYASNEEAVSGTATADIANDTKASKRNARYGKNARSPLRDERNAIISMGELVKLFRGKVDLANPEYGVYLLEGLKPCDIMLDINSNGNVGKSKLLLARVIAHGPKVCAFDKGIGNVRFWFLLCCTPLPTLNDEPHPTVPIDIHICPKPENMYHHHSIMPHCFLHSLQYRTTATTWKTCNIRSICWFVCNLTCSSSYHIISANIISLVQTTIKSRRMSFNRH